MIIQKDRLTKRQRLILKCCNIEGEGLEIGPSFRPIAPKKLGFNIKTMDYLDRKGLVEKCKNDPNSGQYIENIEEVDYVWSGESYLDLIGSDKKFDYIISSHLIEHVPDLIQHLTDCSSLLKSEGVYTLAVPDQRYSFDCFRQLTTVKDCMLTYHQNNHSIASITDYFLNVVNKNGKISWNKYEAEGCYSFIHSLYSQGYFNTEHEKDSYIDIHESVFTPSSFTLLIADLRSMGLIDLQIASLTPAEYNGEFYVTLKKTDNSYRISNDERIHLMKKMLLESLEPLECDLINRYFKKTFDNNFRPKNIENTNEYFVDQFEISDDKNILQLRGWIKLNDDFTACDMFVKIGETYYKIECEERPDVSKVFALKNTNLGFFAKLPLELIKFLEGGTIKIIASDKNCRCIAVDINQTIEVRE